MFTHLHLENFKNFQEADLKLGPFTLLVGANAAGKSNLRDAFRFLHGIGRGYSIAEIIGEKYGEAGVLQWRGIRGGSREIACNAQREFLLRIKLSEAQDSMLSPPEHAYYYSIGVELDDSAAKVASETLDTSLGYEIYRSTTHKSNRVNEFRMISILIQNSDSGMAFHFEQFSNASPVLNQIYNDVKNANYGPLVSNAVSEVTNSMTSIRFLDLYPDAMRQPTFPGQDVLGDRGENLSSVLYAIYEDENGRETLLSWLRELTPMDAVDFEFPTDQIGRILATLVEANGNKTSLYSASDGTLRFLAMVAALLGPKPARLYFFEEIDSGIHPTRLHLLLQLIEQVVSEGKIQIIATTHSPALLRLLSPASLEFASLVYRSHEHPAARIIPLLDLPEARRVFETQDVATLFETGWLEDVVAFGDADKEP